MKFDWKKEISTFILLIDLALGYFYLFSDKADRTSQLYLILMIVFILLLIVVMVLEGIEFVQKVIQKVRAMKSRSSITDVIIDDENHTNIQ